jgi:AcrR family transcriptional regulator
MAPRHKESERETVRQETRALLLGAAAEEFAREGYRGANINRISRAAGFAKGTIYNYFPSKRAVMLALIEETAQAHVDFIVEQVAEEEDPVSRLERFFQAGFAFVPSHLPQSLVMVNNIYGPDVEFKQFMYQAYQPLFQFVGQEIVAAGISRGIFRPVDPSATAGLLMTIYLGTGSTVDDKGRPWLDPRQVAAFALDGLRGGETPVEKGETL